MLTQQAKPKECSYNTRSMWWKNESNV